MLWLRLPESERLLLCQLAAADSRSGPPSSASRPVLREWPAGPLSTWPHELRRLWPPGDDPNQWSPSDKRRWIEEGP